MDKTKLRIAAAISVAAGLTAAGAGGASAAEPSIPPVASTGDLPQPIPHTVERLMLADVQAGSREASPPQLIRAQVSSPPDQYYAPPSGYYSPPEGYYVRDQYGRFYYYDPYRQPYTYTYPNNGYLYRDQYGRYYYYNPYGEAPYD